MAELLLHELAATGDSHELESMLMINRMDVNQLDDLHGNRSALHWAATKGHAKCTKLLLMYGADAASKMVGGWTPAHCAAENGKLNVLKVLVEHDAPVTLPDNSGDTPKRIAEIYGHQACVELLQSVEDSKVQKQLRMKDKMRHVGRLSTSDSPLPPHLMKLTPKHLLDEQPE